MLECPKCKSNNINTLRMKTGVIYCKDCGYKELHKETYNPFIKYTDKQKELLSNEIITDR